MKIQAVVLWVMTLCSDVVGYQCFRGPSIFTLNVEAAWHDVITKNTINLNHWYDGTTTFALAFCFTVKRW